MSITYGNNIPLSHPPSSPLCSLFLVFMYDSCQQGLILFHLLAAAGLSTGSLLLCILSFCLEFNVTIPMPEIS